MEMCERRETGENAKDSNAWPDGMEPKTLFCAKAAIRQRVKLRIMITTNDIYGNYSGGD